MTETSNNHADSSKPARVVLVAPGEQACEVLQRLHHTRGWPLLHQPRLSQLTRRAFGGSSVFVVEVSTGAQRLEALRLIGKLHDYWRKLWLIACTPTPTAPNEHAARQAGADVWVPGPIDTNSLESLIARYPPGLGSQPRTTEPLMNQGLHDPPSGAISPSGRATRQ